MSHPSSIDEALHRTITAIEAIKKGGMVIMTDDEDRENEGDVVFAAEDCTPDRINFMAREARGLICLSMEEARIQRLNLPMMHDVAKSHGQLRTAFTVSIEAREGVTTGISAADRCRTIQVACADNATSDDIVVPGHVFPIKAKRGGVLERVGHTEGSVDLVRLAGKKGAAVICEVMNEDGTMARGRDLEMLAAKYELPIVRIADLVTFRMCKETLIEEVARRTLTTAWGTCTAVWFRNVIDQSVHLAMYKGGPFNEHTEVDVRVHKQNPIDDVFPFLDPQLHGDSVAYALQLLKEKEHALVVYLTQERQNDAILDALQVGTRGQATDPLVYGTGAQIIKSLGVHRMRLHLKSERSLKALHGFGLDLTAIVLMPSGGVQ